MITYITGGERSGKSSFGQRLALEKSNNPVYLATAEIMDSDFENRVNRHKQERDERWTTVEESVYLTNHNLHDKTVLLDCVTLWLYNIYYRNNQEVNIALKFAKSEWETFAKQEFNLIAISNELGMGVHGTTAEIRKFVELQGWMNQFIAEKANEAYLMVSGIPVKIK